MTSPVPGIVNVPPDPASASPSNIFCASGSTYVCAIRPAAVGLSFTRQSPYLSLATSASPFPVRKYIFPSGPAEAPPPPSHIPDPPWVLNVLESKGFVPLKFLEAHHAP